MNLIETIMKSIDIAFMKKICLILLLFCSNVLSFSQPAKSRLFIGGNLGFYISTDDTKNADSTTRNSSIKSLTVLPMAGYFLTNKIAVGIRTGVNFQTINTPNAISYKIERSSIVINPFARYYFWKYGSGNGLFSVAGAVGLFTDFSLSAALGKEKQYIDPDEYLKKIQHLSAGISPGIFYYLTNRFSFEAKFGWFGFESKITSNSDEKNIINYYGFNLTPESFVLGMNFTLN